MTNSLLINSTKNTLSEDNAFMGNFPGYFICVGNVLQSAQQPLSMDELVKKTAHVLPVSTEEPHTMIHRALEKLFQAVPLGHGKYGWLSTLLQDNWIRHPLTTEEAEQGFLLMDELEHAAFFPQFFQTHRSDGRILQIDLLGGPTIQAEAYIERKTWSLKLGQEFVDWIEEHGGQGRDDILILVNDAVAGHYTLRLQPREARIDSEIQEKNIQLALLAEELIRKNRHMWDVMPTWELAARLVANGAFMHDTPPDDLHCILHQYSLLHYSGSGYMLKTDVGHGVQPSDYSALTTMGTPFTHTHPSPAEQDVLITASNTSLPWDVEDTQEVWRVQNGNNPAPKQERDSSAQLDGLDDYDAYLDNLCRMGLVDSPLSLDQFLLLSHEFEFLVSLECQFGYLLTEQKSRQGELRSLLLIDANPPKDDHMDASDQTDLDDPFIWGN